jgi:multidrug efflux pump subunit AcrB
MKLILLALRHPITVLIAIVGIVLGSFLAVGKPVFQALGLPYPNALPQGMEVDIFPALNLPVIYVCQPYGGMDPAQMEGYLTNYYEYHFLYISGIHHVESRNVQGVALMKLHFHPGTDMSQAMAETINYVNRSQAFMPPGTVSPFVMRFDTGSVPVGRLVFSSETRTIAEIQDIALMRVRPMFAALPGVSAPPPFGGAQRSVVVTIDPHRLQAYDMSPDEVIQALVRNNRITPSGNVPIGDKYPIVPVNSVVKNVKDLEATPIRTGPTGAVYLRDLGSVQDFMDAPTGYALVNGRRAVYILATKRANASTLSVVNEIKKALPGMEQALGEEGKGIDISFEFDQTPYVTRGVTAVVVEGALGAILVGLMILLFLRDWRSSLVVILNIPLALLASVLMLWLTGQTLNLMTLGGLALAIGILVDEATVEIENIHSQMERVGSIARAVKLGNAQTAVPRFLAMVCILAVFISAFFMQGAARALFVPLAMAVGFSMVASYILSSTFVPVISIWLLRGHAEAARHHAPVLDRLRAGYVGLLAPILRLRGVVIPAYLLLSILIIAGLGPQLGQDIFPTVDAGQFRLRFRAPDGTHIGRTEEIAQQVLGVISDEVGAENIDITLGYVGMIHSSYPVNSVFHWVGGPEETTLWVDLKDEAGIDVSDLQERLRGRFRQALPDVRFSFEPADIVNEVMSFGASTPIEIAVSGANLQQNREFAEKIRVELEQIAALRDVQYGQSLDYPTLEVNIDRERAGLAGVTPSDVANSLVGATSSSRFVVPIFWADPKSGIGYQVQVEVPRAVIRSADGIDAIDSIDDLRAIPVRRSMASAGNSTSGQSAATVRIRDVAEVREGTMPGQFDRYNMRRQVTLTANIVGEDLGTVSRQVALALGRAGQPPDGMKLEVRGQIPPMQEMLTGLGVGLLMSIVVIFLLLAANYQSLRLALVTVSTAPAVVAGVVLLLFVTGTTLNIQSFIGSIMAVGVAMANAILLVTFAEQSRRQGVAVETAARTGAESRMRAVLMTTCAMIAGMIPMALAIGEAGAQNAPLGRAVVGGLAAGTLATFFVLPCMFAILQRRATTASGSLDPDDPDSAHFHADEDASNLNDRGVA